MNRFQSIRLPAGDGSSLLAVSQWTAAPYRTEMRPLVENFLTAGAHTICERLDMTQLRKPPQEPAAKKTKARLRIVVAVGEPEMREHLQAALGALGHLVVAIAITGEELMGQCAAVQPDLVTADRWMPDMDGLTATRKLFQRTPFPSFCFPATLTRSCFSEQTRATFRRNCSRRFDRKTCRQRCCLRSDAFANSWQWRSSWCQPSTGLVVWPSPIKDGLPLPPPL